MTDCLLPPFKMWRHLPRFYSSSGVSFLKDTCFELDKHMFQHAIQARRLKVGQFVIVFDGEGAEYLAQIDSIGRYQATVCWKDMQSVSRESTADVVLVIGLIASDRMDWVVQKATELGVKAIQPVITQYSFQLIDHKWPEKQEHWKEVAVSACEQCGRNCLPEVYPIRLFSKWIESDFLNAMTIVLSPFAEQSLGSILNHGRGQRESFYVCIGPEGGLASHEEELLCHKGWQQAGLGPRILRAETAALAALSQILIG